MKKNVQIANKLTIIDTLSIKNYLSDISKLSFQPLSAEKERLLFADYAITTDKRIKNKIKNIIVNSNLRFVITVAKQFTYSKVLVEDVINEGNIGLIEAVDKFDYTKDVRFLTFAVWYIRQAIQRYIHTVSADIVQPANRLRINNLLKKINKFYEVKGIYDPTSEMIIERYNRIKEAADPVLTTNLLNEIRVQMTGFVSMNTPLVPSADYTLEESIHNDAEYNTDYAITKAENNLRLNNYLNILTDREREIVIHSFGLNSTEEKTLDQLASMLGYTRERIGQILAGSLAKLKSSNIKAVIPVDAHNADFKYTNTTVSIVAGFDK